MIEIFLGLLSVGMVTSYITVAAYCGLNLWYNHSVMHQYQKKSFAGFFIAVSAMMFCGTNWIVNMDYMKVPLWQALGWGIMHFSLPYSLYCINLHVCEHSSIMKCNAIRDKVINFFKIDNPLQGYVGSH